MALLADVDVETWDKNLRALCAVDPSLGERLAKLAIPAVVQPATGRDGKPTFRIQRQDGHVEWFGRTSMPSISAEGLLAQFNAGSGNIVLAGIGTGLEAKHLSERTGRHRAVIVLEQDPVNLALALRLWDLSAGLRNWQIILLEAADLPGLRDRLVQLCLSHPGLEPPTRMLAWSWRSRAENQPWQVILEEIIQRVRQEQNKQLSERLRCLAAAHQTGTMVQAIAVLTTSPGALAARAVEALVVSARAIGLEAAGSWVDCPLRAGSLAGLETATRISDRDVQIILVDQTRNHWPLGGLPNQLISWMVTAELPDDVLCKSGGKDDWIVAACESQKAQLLKLGWPPERVLVGGPFIGPGEFENEGRPEGGTTNMREGIVLLHDLTPEEPELAGVTLYSHRVLWQALRERLHRQADNWRPAEAERWLMAAQAETGTDLGDPAVQEQFMAMVQRYLAPSVVLSRAARAIIEAGLPLRIAGAGWGKEWAPQAIGPMDDARTRAAVLRKARVVIVGDVRPGQAWLALEAAAAGTAIMARTFWPASDATSLFAPDKEILAWTAQQQMVERLRHLLKNETARTALVEQARRRAMAEHSASAQLKKILIETGMHGEDRIF